MSYDYWEMRYLFDSCTTLSDIIAAVDKGQTDSMCTVVELLTYVYKKSSPNPEETDKFLFSMEELCEKRQMQRVPWQIIDPIISALKHAEHSKKDQAEELSLLLSRIRHNTGLSSPNRENIVLQCDRKPWELNDVEKNGDRYVYKFKHPGAGKCTRPGQCGFININMSRENNQRSRKEIFNELQNEDVQNPHRLKWLEYEKYFYGYNDLCMELVTDKEEDFKDTDVHCHDIISTRDMCMYHVDSIHLHDGRQGPFVETLETISLLNLWIPWWFGWMPKGWRYGDKYYYVTYNVSNFMVVKSK